MHLVPRLQQRPYPVGDVFCRDAEMAVQVAGRSGSAETLHAYEPVASSAATLAKKPPVPALTHACLYGDADCARRQHSSAVGFVLLGEKFRTRH